MADNMHQKQAASALARLISGHGGEKEGERYFSFQESYFLINKIKRSRGDQRERHGSC
ncbi:hypothetical protein [Pokkaliibacter plantistimulans]|uniref:hypothetical protein n=1 Tax=Pokkaliibacter plantistimulans TaxID=1635171 RepID=UPI002D7A15FF|nr:hypothetical protein [Pokkaliibacter plantistimulans]